MADYLLTPKARQDLEAIWDTGVQRWGRAHADRHIRTLAATFALIADFPELAPLRDEFSPPIRIHPHGAHLVLYHQDGGVVILRVLHGRQDLLAALEEGA